MATMLANDTSDPAAIVARLEQIADELSFPRLTAGQARDLEGQQFTLHAKLTLLLPVIRQRQMREPDDGNPC